MPKTKNDNDSTRAQVKERLGIPSDYIPLTSEEFILQQEFIRDTAMAKVVEILTSPKFKARGILALQELGLRAQAAILEERKVNAQIDPDNIVDGTVIGYELTLPVPRTEVEA
jgi:hypothetical protein